MEELILEWLAQVIAGENPPASIANFFLNVTQVVLGIAMFFVSLYLRALMQEQINRWSDEREERRKRTNGQLKTRKGDSPTNPYDGERITDNDDVL